MQASYRTADLDLRKVGGICSTPTATPMPALLSSISVSTLAPTAFGARHCKKC